MVETVGGSDRFPGGHKTPTHQTREELIRQADSLATLWQIQRAETEQRAAALGIWDAGRVLVPHQEFGGRARRM